MLRALGYPRIISMENFRKPNFKLVVELLQWIIKRFNPNATLPEALDTEQERVIFIKAAVLSLLQNARIKLNPKKLYQADGFAVQELIIPVQLLYNSPNEKAVENDADFWKELRSRLQNVQNCRQTAASIPTKGATIYDLLTKELLAKEGRLKALSFALNFADVEKLLREAMKMKEEELSGVEKNVANINTDEAALDEKILRRRNEYDQHQKRLAKLQAFRPQHMDEYEKFEARLKQLYETYVVKFRNLSYLQYMLTEAAKNEQQRNAEVEQNIRNIIERKRAEELAKARNLRSEMEAEGGKTRNSKGRVFGNITGAGIVDEDEDEDDDEGIQNYVENLNNDDGSDEDAAIEKEIEKEAIALRDDSTADTYETNGGDDDKLETSSNDDF
ncbi:unnamed protein product [Enterobius vermicularis]|uniref:Clusterin-associated protein 1 n=1 Tax=Enterobius vermicularis TaxID=51028 RepID=A0A0N4UZ12_ENTVE|nr:unnamed protein product [Enterobius vermicularis]